VPRVYRNALRRRSEARDAVQDALAGLSGSERVLAFFRTFLRHTHGELRGKPFDPLPFQVDFIRAVYDPTLPDGRRRVREALLMLPRKNGKSALCAGLALYHTFAGEWGGQIIAAANSREQAGLIFTAAADMLDLSPVLRSRALVSRAVKRITDRVSHSVCRAISAEAGTAHGLNCSLWLFDELHMAKNSDLLDALRTSVGARREPLGIVISTAGYDKLSPLGILYDHGKRWLDDPSIDPSFSATIYEAGEDDAWDDPATWQKANPAAGAFRSLEELATAAQRAKQIPSEQDAFKRYYLNQWTAQESSWLDMAAWDACAAKRDDATLLGLEAHFGLDLSAVADLTALTALIPVDGKTVLRAWAWIPADGIREREDRERVPYRKWIEDGLIETCPGSAIDHDFITDRVIAICGQYQTMRVSFDRWGSTAVSQRLTDAGLAMVPLGQGFASLSAPTKALQTAILRNELEHDGSPLLRWQAANCTVIADNAGNIKPVKADRLRHRKHIDSIVAAAMAMDGIMRKGPNIDDFLNNPIGI
jgi:phage terminase large subunit-like protein